MLFIVMVAGTYAFLCLLLYGMNISIMWHAFVDFLRAPQWRAWMIWPSGIYGGIAAMVVVSEFGKQRRELKLLQWGTPARAVATLIVSRGQYWEFEYADAAGNLVRNRHRPTRVPEGYSGVMTVLYNPDRPQEFISYPGVRYEIG